MDYTYGISACVYIDCCPDMEPILVPKANEETEAAFIRSLVRKHDITVVRPDSIEIYLCHTLHRTLRLSNIARQTDLLR